jgi:predicted kinase
MSVPRYTFAMLILMAGLPGTGKSTVAAALASHVNGVVLSKDVVRHALFSPELIEYSTTQDDFVIEVLLLTAVYIWSMHPQQTIILDGRTFSRASQRQHVIDFAERARQPWRIIECICAGDIAKARLSRPDPGHPAGNRTPALYEEVKSRWEPITQEHLTVRTDAPVDYGELGRRLPL